MRDVLRLDTLQHCSVWLSNGDGIFSQGISQRRAHTSRTGKQSLRSWIGTILIGHQECNGRVPTKVRKRLGVLCVIDRSVQSTKNGADCGVGGPFGQSERL